MKTKSSDKNKKNMSELILIDKSKKSIKRKNMRINWIKSKLNFGKATLKIIVNMTDIDKISSEKLTSDINKFCSNKFNPKPILAKKDTK